MLLSFVTARIKMYSMKNNQKDRFRIFKKETFDSKTRDFRTRGKEKRWIESRFFETFVGRETPFEIEFVGQLRQLWNCQWRSIRV